VPVFPECNSSPSATLGEGWLPRVPGFWHSGKCVALGKVCFSRSEWSQRPPETWVARPASHTSSFRMHITTHQYIINREPRSSLVGKKNSTLMLCFQQAVSYCLPFPCIVILFSDFFTTTFLRQYSSLLFLLHCVLVLVVALWEKKGREE
jgi:hypothetical protein